MRSSVESVVAGCDETPFGVEVVVVAPPVTSGTGTSTEPAVTVIVDVGSGPPSATLPHMNMTAGIPKLPLLKQLFISSTLDVLGLAQARSLYTCSVALPVGQLGRSFGTMPTAPEVTRQVSRSNVTVAFTRLLSVH